MPGMHRHRLSAFAAAAALAIAAMPAWAPATAQTAARQRELDTWWAHQREKEAADRFWNGPREQRRNLTRDQIERWEEQRNYRGQGPSGLAGPSLPYGRYGPLRRF